jgi:hypothetical protein
MYNTITKEFTGVAAVQVSCWCGILFAVPKSLFDYYTRQNDRQPGSYELCCPLGHKMIPAGQSEAAKLRDELARERHRTEQARAEAEHVRQQRDAAERRVAARKGVATRLKRKIAAGRCPCCSHLFKDLKQHMRTEHPKWDPEQAATALESKVTG